MPHIAAIGAGITGVTTAYALIERGYSVSIIDRQHYAAMETSFANGGQLSVSNAEVWNSWATVFKGLGWIMTRDAPLLMNPVPSLHKYGWMAEFVANIANYRSNTVATARLALEARRHLLRIVEQEKIEFDHVRRGILHIYRERSGFEKAHAVNALLNEAGLERHAVDESEILKIEPTLHGRFVGGYFTPSDSTGDIHKFTAGLAEACLRRGAEMKLGYTVTAIDVDAGVTVACIGEDGRDATIQCDAVVVCAGSNSRKLAADLGDRDQCIPGQGLFDHRPSGRCEQSERRAVDQLVG